MRVVVATGNAHKLSEIRSMLAVPDVTLVGLDAFPSVPEVVEDGDTFEANAIKKATEVCRATGLPALADDSGLEVEALGGAPGVRSARYAGEPADHAANNRKLLAALAGTPNRAARFRCVLALAEPGGRVRTVEGRCDGEIATAPRGASGFGYDPLFIPRGHDRTFGEMSADEKNGLSHRGRALAAARRIWTDYLAHGAAQAPPPDA